MTAMATPPRFTVTMPHRQLRLPTTNQRVRKKTPVQPSHPPPQHLLNARPKATAKASGGGGASSCGAKRGANKRVKDTSKAAKINPTEYLEAPTETYPPRVARPVRGGCPRYLGHMEKVHKDPEPRWGAPPIPPPRVAQLVRQALGRLIRGSGAYRRGGWRQDVQGHEAPYPP